MSLPQPSASYDCDDATMAMYRHFQSLGVESTPIVGNLELTGEDFKESNHVWLLVKYGGKEIAYDWGIPRFDHQHYEGYVIGLDFLIYAVASDIKGDDALVTGER
jgi:hypothetical protein